MHISAAERAYKPCFCSSAITYSISERASIPERSGMRIACFDVRMKVVLNVKVGRAVGVGADQDPVETKDKQCQKCDEQFGNIQWKRSLYHAT